MREFAANGLAGARIDEIAERTLSSKRMIYYYFTDKEGLYLRCLEEAYRVVRSGETKLELEHLAPIDGLRRLVEFTFDHHNSHPDFIRMVMNENVHRAEYLRRSDLIENLNATAIDNLARLYARGVADGSFRAGLQPLDLHWHISALCFFNVSNRATFGAIFGVELGSPEEQQVRRQQVVDLITSYVRASPA
jgi:AcrR family transcriptional regulator